MLLLYVTMLVWIYMMHKATQVHKLYDLFYFECRAIQIAKNFGNKTACFNLKPYGKRVRNPATAPPTRTVENLNSDLNLFFFFFLNIEYFFPTSIRSKKLSACGEKMRKFCEDYISPGCGPFLTVLIGCALVVIGLGIYMMCMAAHYGVSAGGYASWWTCRDRRPPKPIKRGGANRSNRSGKPREPVDLHAWDGQTIKTLDDITRRGGPDNQLMAVDSPQGLRKVY